MSTIDIIQPATWLHSPSQRSKRTEVVKGGFYVLEYDPTGRFYIRHSDHVSDDVDKDIEKLKKGKHPCKLLNELYAREPVIRVFEFPCRASKKRLEKVVELIKNQTVEYLCLNQTDYVQVRKTRRKRG